MSCVLCLWGGFLQPIVLLHFPLTHFSYIYTEISEHLVYFQLKTGGTGRFLQSWKMFLPVPCILPTIFILILGGRKAVAHYDQLCITGLSHESAWQMGQHRRLGSSPPGSQWDGSGPWSCIISHSSIAWGFLVLLVLISNQMQCKESLRSFQNTLWIASWRGYLHVHTS